MLAWVFQHRHKSQTKQQNFCFRADRQTLQPAQHRYCQCSTTTVQYKRKKKSSAAHSIRIIINHPLRRLLSLLSLGHRHFLGALHAVERVAVLGGVALRRLAERLRQQDPHLCFVSFRLTGWFNSGFRLRQKASKYTNQRNENNKTFAFRFCVCCSLRRRRQLRRRAARTRQPPIRNLGASKTVRVSNTIVWWRAIPIYFHIESCGFCSMFKLCSIMNNAFFATFPTRNTDRWYCQ